MFISFILARIVFVILYKTIRKVNGSDTSNNKIRDFHNKHPSKNNKYGCHQNSKQTYGSNDADSIKPTVLYIYPSSIACRNMTNSYGAGSLTITNNINYS